MAEVKTEIKVWVHETGEAYQDMDDPKGQYVEADLLYDESDPYAVQFLIQAPGQGTIAWHLDRTLLNAGAHSPFLSAGLGDVKLKTRTWMGEASLSVCLENPTGHADLEMPLAVVKKFLAEAYLLVPRGEEKQDTDDCIRRILEDA